MPLPAERLPRMPPRDSPGRSRRSRRCPRGRAVPRLAAGWPPTRSIVPCSCTGSPLASSRANARLHCAVRTSATVRPAVMSSAVPAAATFPSAMIISRSHCSASSMLWVVTSTPAPAVAACRISSQSRALPRGPTPEVGSSSTRSSGRWERATANATWRCAPSGRLPTSSFFHAEMPPGSGVAAIAERRGREVPVLRHREAGVQAEGLRDVPDPAAGRDRGSLPEQPYHAVAGGQQAEQQPDERRLAGAVRAEQPEDLAGADGEVDCGHRREPAEAPCCRAGFGEEPHRVTSPPLTMLAGERGGDHGVLEVRRHRPRALRERACRVPYPPGDAAPPRQRGGPLGAVHDADYAGDVVQDLRRGAAGRHLPCFQQHHHGGAGCLVHVGRADGDGGPRRGGSGDEPPQLGAADRVDSGRGLVKNQEVGRVQQGHPDGQLALHSAGELPAQPAAGAAEPGLLQEPVGLLAVVAAGKPVGAGREVEVLLDGQVRVQPRRGRHVPDALLRRAEHGASAGSSRARRAPAGRSTCQRRPRPPRR